MSMFMLRPPFRTGLFTLRQFELTLEFGRRKFNLHNGFRDVIERYFANRVLAAAAVGDHQPQYASAESRPTGRSTANRRTASSPPCGPGPPEVPFGGQRPVHPRRRHLQHVGRRLPGDSSSGPAVRTPTATAPQPRPDPDRRRRRRPRRCAAACGAPRRATSSISYPARANSAASSSITCCCDGSPRTAAGHPMPRRAPHLELYGHDPGSWMTSESSINDTPVHEWQSANVQRRPSGSARRGSGRMSADVECAERPSPRQQAARPDRRRSPGAAVGDRCRMR